MQECDPGPLLCRIGQAWRLLTHCILEHLLPHLAANVGRVGFIDQLSRTQDFRGVHAGRCVDLSNGMRVPLDGIGDGLSLAVEEGAHQRGRDVVLRGCGLLL